MGYKPGVPAPELRDGLLAARKDMVNFINNISGLNMTREERSRFLASMPTIRIWWKALFAEIEWIDKYMKRMLDMIARARAIAHGNAYTTYSTLKRDAEYVCSENIAGDMTMAVTEDDLDSIWMQFKYAGENYISGGRGN